VQPKRPRHVEQKHEVKQEEKLEEAGEPEISGAHLTKLHEEKAAEHADVLASEFTRYARDYEIRVTGSTDEACAELRRIVADGGQVPLLVTESALPDSGIYQAFVEWRTLVPTAKRVIAAHWSRFLADAEVLREGMAKGKYDAYLLMPRGARDEEFHGAIVEMLSDWGSSVAAPEVDSVRIVSPAPWNCGRRYNQPTSTTRIVAARRTALDCSRISAKSGMVKAPERRRGAATNTSRSR
jgi:hypothetical protein